VKPTGIFMILLTEPTLFERMVDAMIKELHPKSLTHRRLYPAGVANVSLADNFWSPKQRILRTVTVNDVFDKFERDGAFTNFDRVAQGLSGGHCGSPWFDGLIYETMRAVSDFLAADYDAQLDARMDGYIERIAAAQAVDPDGYINTFVTLMRPEKRWGADGSDQLWTHEEYDAGCLVEAGVHHYQATGKTTLLSLAVRLATYMCEYIGPAPKHNVVPSHSLPEEAFIKLYRLLRDEPGLAEKLSFRADPPQFLDLVRFWLENRGNHTGRISFAEYAQDHCCLFDQPEAVGHSVRGTLLYTGLAALAAEAGESKYFEVSRRLWEDVVERKMFITGGVGPIKEYEGFGFGYYLPNSGYIETCAGAGLAFWASQMNQAFGAGEYMDVYERVIYNNVLAGVSLDGNRYSYENPLHNQGTMHRWDWHRCPCCPPMLLKLIAEMPGLIYAQDGEDIFINLYTGSHGKISLPAGEVEVTLKTSYPWDGAVKITLQQKESRAYGLRLRIPAWCQSYRVRVNGVAQGAQETSDGYAFLKRVWQAGDIIELELDMPVQRIVGHPFAGAIRERVAIQRGPVVYCLEGVDHPSVNDPLLPETVQFQAQFRSELLGGVVAITSKDVDGNQILAVPYFTWDNRAAPNTEQDWLVVWLRQEDWFHLRKPLDGNDRKAWEHLLYQPLDTSDTQ
jgi:DUF1680 family protein